MSLTWDIGAGGAAMVLSKGVGITAGRKPMSAYRRKPGETHGHHWYFPSIRRSGEFPHVLVDTNYWKSFVHADHQYRKEHQVVPTITAAVQYSRRQHPDHLTPREYTGGNA